jgi:hypothetical protein
MPKFNTCFDFCFSVDHDCENPFAVPEALLIAACRKRLDDMEAKPDEAADAFGVCETHEIATDETRSNGPRS